MNNLEERQSLKMLFSENIGRMIDIKSTGISARRGEIISSYDECVLIDFERESAYKHHGLFYVTYRHIVDFQFSDTCEVFDNNEDKP